MRTTVNTRLEYLLYQLAVDHPSILDAVERFAEPHTAYSVTAGDKAHELATEFAREQIDMEMGRDARESADEIRRDEDIVSGRGGAT